MSTNHTFSIIAYEESPFLEECIRSLQNQTVKSKIILCTSTPLDSILRIAKRYSIPVKINPNPGKANDWNFAYNQAKTKYLTLAHHDDTYSLDYTERMLSAFKTCEDALIGFSDYAEAFIDADNKEIIKNKTTNLQVKRIILNLVFLHRDIIHDKFLKKVMLSFGDTISCPTVTFNKQKLEDFKFSQDLNINLDWAAWWDLANEDGAFIWIKSEELLHRIHLDSHTTEAITGDARLNDDIVMFNKIWPKPISTILVKLYTLSYIGNKI